MPPSLLSAPPTLAPRGGEPRLLFCSYHSYLDPSSGAALSTRDLLGMLAAAGWPCAALTGPQLDFEGGGSLESLLRAEKIPFQAHPGTILGHACLLYDYTRDGVPAWSYAPAEPPREAPGPPEERAFLALFDEVCRRFRPDLLLTYGGQPVAHRVIGRAKELGLKVIFSLRNFSYRGRDLFRHVDAVQVPSRAAQRHYRQALGLDSTVIPGPWNWDRVRCDGGEGRFVTFINPQPAKGALWFARIAYEMNRRRPDIPFLVVEGRGDAGWLAQGGLDLTGLRNLHRMPNTSDPRQFYRLSRLVLMPSLWQEAFGRVVVEAFLNGIPVLASRRGGLPEVLAEAGFLFDIPERYTPQSREAPAAAEVAPWLETIERLWDDADFYRGESRRCLRAAEAWRPERLRPRFEEFFRRVLRGGGASVED